MFQVQSELMVEKRNIFEQELDKEVKVCTTVSRVCVYYLPNNIHDYRVCKKRLRVNHYDFMALHSMWRIF